MDLAPRLELPPPGSSAGESTPTPGAGLDGAAPVHDVVCTAYLVQPDVVTTRSVPVAVETVGSLTVGRTVLDTRPDTVEASNAHVALDADPAVLTELLTRTFA
jgi:inosine-uridine nucleoside N-ribohydrolase